MISSLVVALAALAPTAFGAILDVNVGPNGQFVYEPPFVHAMAGDIVRFRFNPKNHTVTQSAFDPPCVPLAGGNGFRTGFIPVAPGTDPLPVQEFTVPDNHGEPLWFYCGQVNHCGAGMVFAINPPADPHAPNSFEAHRQLAIARNGTNAAAPPPPPPTTTWYPPAENTPYYPPPAQTTAPAQPPAAVPAGREHKVTVGADGKLEYVPANIKAAVGDTVTFEFRPKNHTVTQSAFNNPCSPLAGGLASGFRPVAADATSFPTFQIKINDTKPIFGYCGQVNHCQSGMVFAINADDTGAQSFDALRKLATAGTSSSTSGGATVDNAGFAVSPRVRFAAATVVFAGLVAGLL